MLIRRYSNHFVRYLLSRMVVFFTWIRLTYPPQSNCQVFCNQRLKLYRLGTGTARDLWCRNQLLLQVISGMSQVLVIKIMELKFVEFSQQMWRDQWLQDILFLISENVSPSSISVHILQPIVTERYWVGRVVREMDKINPVACYHWLDYRRFLSTLLDKPMQ